MGAGFRLASSPEPVLRQARKVLADSIGCMLAGARTPVVNKLMEVIAWNAAARSAGPGSEASPARQPGSGAACTLPGRAERLDPLCAALVNGTSCHALELDDGYTPGSAHPGSVVVPAVLAVGEAEGSSLGQVLEAIIVGYEVMLTAAEAIHPESRRRGFHNTGVAGVFGAAAAAAKILDLRADETRHALGLAASFAGGLLAFWNEGEQGATDIKKVHPGKAARDGVFCAVCAARGMRGPATVFEGKAGLLRAYGGKGGEVGPRVGLAGGRETEGEFPPATLPDRPKIMDVYFKPWPCCRSLHGPIALALRLRRTTGSRLGSIDSIRVDTYSLAAERSRTEAEGHDAHFSIPLTVALALLEGEVSYQSLAEAHRNRPVSELARKVTVIEDEEFSRRYPNARPARLTLKFESGETLSEELEYPPGEPQEPLLAAQIMDKFLANSATSIPAGIARRVLKLAFTADPDLPISEVSQLVCTRAPATKPTPGSKTSERGCQEDA